MVAANQDPRLTSVFSTFSATTPSLYLDVDRDKAQALGVRISDVFTTLQASLGGFYVNDFNLFGRTWQVNIQAVAPDRDDIPTSGASRCATRAGRWCRCAPSPMCGWCWGRRPSSATTTRAA
jgi:multidrug efflux pump subunit AcrB